MKNLNVILISRAISEKLYLSKLDGRTTIDKAKKLFRSSLFFTSTIDPNFEKLGLNKKSKATLETEVEIYEMVKDANFEEIFTSLSDNLDVLCLTQSQIIDFCEKHRSHLRQGCYGTFFLTKKDFEKPPTEDNLFVVRVEAHLYDLSVRVCHFGDSYIWHNYSRLPNLHVVAPKLS
ncbi:MAG TPA: hypothetical protein PK142_03315 [bacterium]|nr:hypothetical protein [bacterium]